MTLIEFKHNQLFTNWSSTFTCLPFKTININQNEQIKQIILLALKSNRRIRVVGSGLSPNQLVYTKDFLINLNGLNKIINIDEDNLQVEVEAGIQLKELIIKLNEFKLAFNNLGSVSDQTIGGILGTSVHGTGILHSSLANHIIEIHYYDGLGNQHIISKEHEEFQAYLCNLGCLGIIYKVKIQCVKQFNLNVQQYPIDFYNMCNQYDKLIKNNEYCRFWWFPHVKDINCIVWNANKTNEKITKEQPISLINRFIKVNLYEVLLLIGKYIPTMIPYINQYYYKQYFSNSINEIKLSYNAFNFDCLFQQNVSEWAIPIKYTSNALKEINNMIKLNNFNVHFPIEIRFVKNETIWLSPAYNNDVCYIGVIMYKPFGVDIEYKEYFKQFEMIMNKYEGRPHWAKPHNLKLKQLSLKYPKLLDFLNLRKQNDLNNIFLNDYLESLLF